VIDNGRPTYCPLEVEDALQARIDELQRKLDFIETYRQEQSQIGCEE